MIRASGEWRLSPTRWGFDMRDLSTLARQLLDPECAPSWPEVNDVRPTASELTQFCVDGVCRAIDGCYPVPAEGRCIHGYPSWLLYLGLV